MASAQASDRVVSVVCDVIRWFKEFATEKLQQWSTFVFGKSGSMWFSIIFLRGQKSLVTDQGRLLGGEGLVLLREVNRLVDYHNQHATGKLERFPESADGYQALIAVFSAFGSTDHQGASSQSLHENLEIIIESYLHELSTAFGIAFLALRVAYDLAVFPTLSPYESYTSVADVIESLADALRQHVTLPTRSTSRSPIHFLLPRNNPYFWCDVPTEKLVHLWTAFDDLNSIHQSSGACLHGAVSDGAENLVSRALERIIELSSGTHFLEKYHVPRLTASFMLQEFGLKEGDCEQPNLFYISN